MLVATQCDARIDWILSCVPLRWVLASDYQKKMVKFFTVCKSQHCIVNRPNNVLRMFVYEGINEAFKPVQICNREVAKSLANQLTRSTYLIMEEQ